jgi:hypothetical protein
VTKNPKQKPSKKAPRSVRLLPEWDVCIWLAEQSEWVVAGIVCATDDMDAVNKARRLLARGWPQLAAIVESCPAAAARRPDPRDDSVKCHTETGG